jgi:DNA-binding CsgD family transcriptional regulator
VAESVGSQLSPRQIECLRLAAAGKTSSEIAIVLGISSRTVDQYVGEACERLKVRNRIQAVAKAMTLGLLSDAPP